MNCKAVQYMSSVQLVEIFSRNDVYLGIPFFVQGKKLRQLRLGFGRKAGKM
jgi:hypothetical protein